MLELDLHTRHRLKSAPILACGKSYRLWSRTQLQQQWAYQALAASSPLEKAPAWSVLPARSAGQMAHHWTQQKPPAPQRFTQTSAYQNVLWDLILLWQLRHELYRHLSLLGVHRGL